MRHEKRTRRVTIALTTRERRELERAAKSVNLDLHDFVREAVVLTAWEMTR